MPLTDAPVVVKNVLATPANVLKSVLAMNANVLQKNLLVASKRTSDKEFNTIERFILYRLGMIYV